MEFRILSLSGGGYMGLYTAAVLADLEEQCGEPLYKKFDLIAGTSIGGIIALGISAGEPVSNVLDAFIRNGAKIFSSKPAPDGKLGELIALYRNAFNAKHSQSELRKVISEILGEETRLGDLKQRTIVPAVNLTKGSPQVFKTPHHSSFVRDWKFKAVDVALATSAAPTYLPIHKIGGEMFADGGLFANSPDAIALHEAEHFLGVDVNDVHLLSIGTTTSKFSFSSSVNPNLGWVGWMKNQRLSSAMISSQQMMSDFVMQHRLGDRYLRVDYEQSAEQSKHLALDVATEAAVDGLCAFAEASLRETQRNTTAKGFLGALSAWTRLHAWDGATLMGIAASLFFSNDETENCLSYRVKPTEAQQAEQQERWNDLRQVLIDVLKSWSGYSLSSWLQGSYKFGTQIRPARRDDEFDIDLGVYFHWPGDHDEGHLSPVELKDLVQRALLDYAENPANDAAHVSEPKARCCRIHFDGDFHIDVPAYHLDQTSDLRGLATEENAWEDSDPKAIYLWWKNSFDDVRRTRARRMVRYLKMWAALKLSNDDRPSSILLTVLVCQAFQELDEANLSGDDEYFRDLVEAITSRLRNNTVVPNPVDYDENINRLSTSSNARLVNQLEALLVTADRALAATTKIDSADIWAEVFEHFFPLPDEEVLAAGVPGTAVAVNAFEPQVRVIATVNGRNFTGLNRIGPIPRGCSIQFELANSDQLPQGSVVKWMVRNTGEDAEAVNDLGHRVKDGLVADERSAYRGTHNMDISVRLNGRTIGRRRIPVTINALGMPPRNPPKKAWTKLR